MEEINKLYSVKTNSLKLTWGRTFAHYAIVPFLLIAPIFTTYSLIQIYLIKNYTGVRTAQELISTGYLWLIPAVLLYFVQKSRLKFREIKISVTPEKFNEAAILTSDKLNWEIQNLTDNYVVAIRKGNFVGGSWGELITIIRNDEKILINSICDPDNIISVASWGWNKKNRKTFEITLEELLKTEAIKI